MVKWIRRLRLLVLVPAFVARGILAAPEQLVQPGAAGEDVSPYSFLPTLPRGERDTNWAFTASENGAEHSFRTFVRFPLPAPPADHTVAYAYIWFYYAFDAAGFGETQDVLAEASCHEVLSDWSEPTLTWSNQPAIGAAFDRSSGIGGPQLFYCDVTELARRWLAGAAPNFGIAIENASARTLGMHSFESTLAPSDDYKPSLLIGYEPGDLQTPSEGATTALAVCLDPLDADGDAIGDRCDVCPTAFDPGQEDADRNGVGDRCGFAAADLSGDGRVTKADRKRFKRAIGVRTGARRFDLRCDLDADGAVDAVDRALWLPIYRAYRGGRR